MIIHDGISEIINYRRIKDLGLTDEYFLSLPFECQRAILMAGLEKNNDSKKKWNNFQKRIALKEYEFEEKTKKKILTLFKKK